MVNVSALSELLVAFSVLFGIVTWYLQNLENKKINQARLFMEIYVRFSDEGFWNIVNEIRNFDYLDIDDFREKYSDYDWNKVQAVGSVFEGIGILVKRNLIDIRFVNDLMPLTVMSVWDKLEPMINEMRKTDWSSSYAFKGFDFLNKEVHKTHQRHFQEWDINTR
jgi:hypothetical protein